MGRRLSCLGLNIICVCFASLLICSVFFVQDIEALTIAYGQPYGGRLINGIQFPNQFPGYVIRDPERSYTCPEVVGALLDAIDAVRQKFPDTCDVFLGDFSSRTGGGALHHRSHQNGRDVDVGLYAKGNRPLDTLVVMTEENLDAPKTWCLIQNIINSQRVQYIFLDRRIQKVLYDYAASIGTDPAYLDRVFGTAHGALIQHVPGHNDHMHIRFFTPWSTLAGHVGESEYQKLMVIEMAQQAYLPQKVNYYVSGNERSIDALAQSFGVTRRELCRWNQIAGGANLTPGSCLVFYKRGFEAEPVHLAQSLQPGFIVETPPVQSVQYASLRSNSILSDAPSNVPADEEESPASAPRKHISAPAPAPTAPVYTTYKVQKGDTLEKIARKNKLDIKALCQLNGMTKSTGLKPGQPVKLAMVKTSSARTAVEDSPAPRSSRGGIQNMTFSSDRKNCSIAAASYKVGKGDTLQKIARRTGIGIEVLCQMNGLKKNAELKPGRSIKLAQATSKSCVVSPPQAKTQASSRAAQPALKNSQAPALKKSTQSKASAPGKVSAQTRSKTAVSSKATVPAGPKAQMKQATAPKPAATGSKVKTSTVGIQKKPSAAVSTGKADKNGGKLAKDTTKQTSRKRID